ncbi:hypothetical protein PPYR_12801 [Photinus pyralis]|uniref:Cytochrome P450 n=1 Tax=Photinus pyralis TaxID=7054 RepID=A0A1Y1LJP7_PHOPY|nr:cytochrome P450 9e2-like [Photinus pyralis]KAB0793181.1 hypothetical protein PPYR_12801 [Photinus pyralis]
MSILIIIVLCLFLLISYLIIIRPYQYWTKKGVRQRSVAKLWLENFKTILQLTPMADSITAVYSEFPNDRYTGTYQFASKLLLIRDPELIKQITVKDFDHFVDHNQILFEDAEPLFSKNLMSLRGERWKEMRATLSPSFTSRKMKAMFGIIMECAQTFVRHFQREDGQVVTVELKDVFTRLTNDIIASASFGIVCDSLKDRDNEFYKMGKEATNFSGFWKVLSFLIILSSPRLAKFLGIRFFDEKVSAFFKNLVVSNIEEREKNGIVRPDMIHLLMQARKGKLEHDRDNEVIDTGFAVIEESAIGKERKRNLQLTDDDVTAQALIFFFAGFESVATLMCFTVYELAADPFVQQKLQMEIDNVLKESDGTLTYESLLKMEYLDMVISEALRKWPIAVATDRVCVKPYTIQPEREGEKPLRLEKGDVISILMYGMHRDAALFPDPDRFDPERFNRENKKNIGPYTYIPFGVGPRSCIANRFALLEIKILIFNLLQHFEVVVVDKSDIPIKLSPKQFTLNAKNGFWFGFKSRRPSV